eukprot:3845488-Pleurochrysis_carterae.AAC.1
MNATMHFAEPNYQCPTIFCACLLMWAYDQNLPPGGSPMLGCAWANSRLSRRDWVKRRRGWGHSAPTPSPLPGPGALQTYLRLARCGPPGTAGRVDLMQPPTPRRETHCPRRPPPSTPPSLRWPRKPPRSGDGGWVRRLR